MGFLSKVCVSILSILAVDIWKNSNKKTYQVARNENGVEQLLSIAEAKGLIIRTGENEDNIEVRM